VSAGMSAASAVERAPPPAPGQGYGARSKFPVNRRGSYRSVAALDHVSGVLELVSVPAWQL
jgi:hypothetical protein